VGLIPRAYCLMLHLPHYHMGISKVILVVTRHVKTRPTGLGCNPMPMQRCFTQFTLHYSGINWCCTAYNMIVLHVDIHTSHGRPTHMYDVHVLCSYRVANEQSGTCICTASVFIQFQGCYMGSCSVVQHGHCWYPTP